MNRRREAHKCIEEAYTLWAMNHVRHPGTIYAATGLMKSCMSNKEYEDAERYGRHAYFLITEIVPSEQQPKLLAEVSCWLARAIVQSSKAVGIPPEDKQQAGEEVIMHARQALKLHTRLSGKHSSEVGGSMLVLADALDYFHDFNDNEVLRLLEQSMSIYRRAEGRSSPEVATCETNLGNAYNNRADRAYNANDGWLWLNQCMSNLEIALDHYREAARIYKANNHTGSHNEVLRNVDQVQNRIREIETAVKETYNYSDYYRRKSNSAY